MFDTWFIHPLELIQGVGSRLFQTEHGVREVSYSQVYPNTTTAVIDTAEVRNSAELEFDLIGVLVTTTTPHDQPISLSGAKLIMG